MKRIIFVVIILLLIASMAVVQAEPAGNANIRDIKISNIDFLQAQFNEATKIIASLSTSMRKIKSDDQNIFNQTLLSYSTSLAAAGHFVTIISTAYNLFIGGNNHVVRDPKSEISVAYGDMIYTFFIKTAFPACEFIKINLLSGLMKMPSSETEQKREINKLIEMVDEFTLRFSFLQKQ